MAETAHEQRRITYDGDLLLVHIPMRLKKRGGRKEIIVPGADEGSEAASGAPQEPLVVALARGHHWRDLLEDGRYASVTALAEGLRVDRAYVRRMIRLTLLAPDIVEAILRGREPSGLSLSKLAKGVPVGWEEQRGLLS